MAVLKKITLLFLLCLFLLPLRAQEFQPTPAQRGVRTSGDVAVGMLAAAGLTAVLVQKDWQGLKQGALSGVTTLGACGGEVYGNIYHNAGSLPVLIGGGHYNHYHHNIFIDSPVAIHLDNRMQNWGAGMVAPDGIIDQRLKAVKFQEPPYSTTYPFLVNYWEENPSYPHGNLIEGNLFYRIKNLVNGQTQWGEFRNNWSTNNDPGFVDPENPLKGFKEDAPVYRYIQGFPQLPFDKIGCTLK